MARFDTHRPAVVTGGAGAIGGFLVRALLARGLEVRVIDNFTSGRREHLPDPATTQGLSIHRGDIRHPGEIEAVFKGAGSVWHLAANPDIRRGTEQPQLDLEHGTVGTSNVLEAARRADVPYVLFSSSSVVYGYPTRFPTPEDYGPLFPQSLYGASKLASEALLSAYAGCFGLSATIFRYANIIGPTMTHGVIYDFFEKLQQTPDRLEVLGDGRQSKSYLRVEDCVTGMLVGAERATAPVEAYNLGTIDRTTVKSIAEMVVAAMGGRGRIEYTGGERGWAGDVPQQELGVERITALGWKPQWGSTAAVERTIAEFAPRFR
jgi:UDP-glucose 4-epimerase